MVTALAEKALHPKRRITVPYEKSTLTQASDFGMANVLGSGACSTARAARTMLNRATAGVLRSRGTVQHAERSVRGPCSHWPHLRICARPNATFAFASGAMPAGDARGAGRQLPHHDADGP